MEALRSRGDDRCVGTPAALHDGDVFQQRDKIFAGKFFARILGNGIRAPGKNRLASCRGVESPVRRGLRARSQPAISPIAKFPLF